MSVFLIISIILFRHLQLDSLSRSMARIGECPSLQHFWSLIDVWFDSQVVILPRHFYITGLAFSLEERFCYDV